MLHHEKAEPMGRGYVALGSDAVDTISFEYVFTTYYSFVSRLARTLLDNAQDAEDVTQEVFLRVYKSLSSYDPQRGTLNAWLAKLTLNAGRTQRRRTFLHRLWRSAPSDDADADVLQLIDHSLFASPEDHALQTELRKTVRSVLAKLRPEHRTVLVLYHYMDLSCVEIASILSCPEGTVYSRLHYARRLVQSHLELELKLTNGGIEA
jgi:RNA polymerase sigma-70 factor (ECF subfamily)